MLELRDPRAPLDGPVDWGDQEKVWHHAMYHELRVRPEEQPVVLVEGRGARGAGGRERSAHIMFETFRYVGRLV